MRIFLLTLIFMLLTAAVASAHEDSTEAKQLIDSGVSCDKLTDDQLEHMGEYYMEQMHPGEAHELMHKMMGLEEGTKSEELFHINMAKVLYCNESNQEIMNIDMMGGMMNMMQSVMGTNGMMNWAGSMSGWSTFGWINQILITIILVLLTIFLYKKVTKK